MKKLIILPILLLLSLILIANSPSQEPPPPLAQWQPGESHTESGTTSNVEAGNNNKATPKPAPRIIPKIKADSSNDSTKHAHEKDSKQGAGWDDPIARYTFWIVVFTSMLVICNILLLYATLKSANAAKQSADAATTTANALLGVELPRFIVTNMKGFRGNDGTYIEIALTNQGRTEAAIISECFVYKEANTLDEKPRYPLHTLNQIDFGCVIESRQAYILRRKVDISDTSTSPILWGYGYIRYRDFLNNMHRFGFVGGAKSRTQLSNGQSFPFNEVGPPAYTYNKYD